MGGVFAVSFGVTGAEFDTGSSFTSGVPFSGGVAGGVADGVDCAITEILVTICARGAQDTTRGRDHHPLILRHVWGGNTSILRNRSAMCVQIWQGVLHRHWAPMQQTGWHTEPTRPALQHRSTGAKPDPHRRRARIRHPQGCIRPCRNSAPCPNRYGNAQQLQASQ